MMDTMGSGYIGSDSRVVYTHFTIALCVSVIERSSRGTDAVALVARPLSRFTPMTPFISTLTCSVILLTSCRPISHPVSIAQDTSSMLSSRALPVRAVSVRFASAAVVVSCFKGARAPQ